LKFYHFEDSSSSDWYQKTKNEDEPVISHHY
jgi:hypothetical protein